MSYKGSERSPSFTVIDIDLENNPLEDISDIAKQCSYTGTPEMHLVLATPILIMYCSNPSPCFQKGKVQFRVSVSFGRSVRFF